MWNIQSVDLFCFFLRELHHRGNVSVCKAPSRERDDVDKSKKEGDNVLAAAYFRLLLCSPAVDGGDR